MLTRWLHLRKHRAEKRKYLASLPRRPAMDIQAKMEEVRAIALSLDREDRKGEARIYFDQEALLKWVLGGD